MRREISKWFSPILNKEMEIVAYGHQGFALLLLPTAAADFLEYERFHLIETLAPFIETGKIKVYSINSINSESWLNDEMPGFAKAQRQVQFNDYVNYEVVPWIENDCNGKVDIYLSGASLGALHSANLFFRRPDLFAGFISMSGSYDLKDYTKGYWDDNVYFNSPLDYLPKLEDENLLNQMRFNKKLIIATGQGNYEKPESSKALSAVLDSKNIPHELDLWGFDMPHDWPTWRKMLPFFIESRF